MRYGFLVFVVGCFVSAACGSGDEPVELTTLYVDGTATAGGDGSSAKPFRTMREALEVGHVVERIVVAAGDYEVPPSWEFSEQLVVQGSAEAPTLLVAEAEADKLQWSSDAVLVLRSVHIGTGMEHTGALELQAVVFEGTTGTALTLTDTTARLFDVTVRELSSEGELDTRNGIVASGGSLTVRGLVASVPDRAVQLEGGVVADLRDVSISGGERASFTVVDGAQVIASTVTITDATVGLFVREATLELDGATIDGSSMPGVMVSTGATATITNSRLLNCRNGHVQVVGGDISLSLTGNELVGALAHECVMVSYAAGTIHIADNSLTTCSGAGVSVNGTTGVVVQHNEISDILPDILAPAVGDGVRLLEAEATIADNTITDCIGAGIALTTADATITGNTITGAGDSGVSIVGPGSERVLVADNEISETEGVGVIVLGAQAEVSDNTIHDVTYSADSGFGDGIAFGDGADVIVTGNHSSSNERNGVVFLSGATGSISNNTFVNNAQYGILELCSLGTNTVTVSDNTLTGNTAGEQNVCGD